MLIATPPEITPGAQYLSDHLWVLVCAVMVFHMQAGFLCFEIGCVRLKNVTATAMKNTVDWMMLSIIFALFGFGVMFGHSENGFFGGDLFMLSGLDSEGANPLGWSFAIYQLAFAGAAATIVSGAMAERTGFIAYAVLASLIGLVIYPVFGHMVWGNAFFGDSKAFLADMGYIDFAGSSVVHMVGACVAAVGIWVVGPRLGRYDESGKPKTFQPHSIAWSALGTLFLWIGWWGFNGGSTLAFNYDVGPIIVNTNIAAAAGGLAAFAHCWAFENREGIEGKILAGTLGGLVAITGCAHVVSLPGALAVGAIAGIIHNVSSNFCLNTLKLDDPVGAVPVHGFCGAWGILSVALFGNPELLPLSFGEQLGVQALGIGVCIAWTCSVSFICLMMVKKFIGLRVNPMEEIAGLTISGVLPEDAAHGTSQESAEAAEVSTEVDEDTAAMLAEMMGGAASADAEAESNGAGEASNDGQKVAQTG